MGRAPILAAHATARTTDGIAGGTLARVVRENWRIIRERFRPGATLHVIWSSLSSTRTTGWYIARAALAAALALAGPLAAAQSEATGGSPPPAYATNAPGSPLVAPASPGPLRGPAPIAGNTPSATPLQPGEAGPRDYRIGSQDLLEIRVYGIDDLKREVRVNTRGMVTLPLIGPVEVGGRTSEEAETLIAGAYAKDYLQDPQVSVFIKEFTSQRITVEGAVARPGIYPIRGDTTLVQAIALAGGQGQLPDLTEVMVFRLEAGQRRTHTYDLIRIRSGEIPDPKLVNEDIVVVKREANRVVLRDSVFGDVVNILNPMNYLPRW